MPAAIIPKTSQFETDWVDKIADSYIMKYGSGIDIDDIKSQLHSVFHIKCYNPKANLVNNYKEKKVESSLIDLYDFLKSTKPIFGGNGCLFMQHALMDNPLIQWIRELQQLRKVYKNKMFSYEKGSPMYELYNRKQLNTKRKINSLYGVLGYHGFCLYNIYLAQAVTALGQNTISAAAQGFEAFIADNAHFVTPDELYQFIKNCTVEALSSEGADERADTNIYIPTEDEVFARMMSKIVFKTSPEFENTLHSMIHNIGDDGRKVVFYKNNLKGFFKNTKFKNILRDYLITLSSIRKNKDGSESKIYSLLESSRKDLTPESMAKNDLIWKYIDTYILYKYPIYDRIRKTKFQYKKVVAYIDTDSNFLGLDPWYHFLETEILEPGDIPTSEEDKDMYNFKIANSFTIWISSCVASSFEIMTKWLNIDADIRKALAMKNEVYYKRILFVKCKKRYVGYMLLNEGNIVTPKKRADIKGFEFKKSVTKENVRDFYEQLSIDEILKCDNIKPQRLFRKIIKFENDMRQSILSGETKYFKQSNIKEIGEYATPYSIQGIKSTVVWNTLCPRYAIQLPMDVDIVPTNLDKGRRVRVSPKVITPTMVYIEDKSVKQKDGTYKDCKVYIENDTPMLRKFKEKYPIEYERLDKQIFHNVNPAIRKMGLSFIAKPKNVVMEIPQWFYDFMDVDHIVDDAIGLYNSILDSVGINIEQVTSTKSHYTNFVSI